MGEAASGQTMAPADGNAPAETAPSAEATAPAPAEPAPVVKAEGNLASLIIGENVYNGTGDDAEKIGDVNDIVLDKDNQAQSLVVGVGGFLGMGQKNVAVDYAKAEWATKERPLAGGGEHQGRVAGAARLRPQGLRSGTCSGRLQRYDGSGANRGRADGYGSGDAVHGYGSKRAGGI